MRRVLVVSAVVLTAANAIAAVNTSAKARLAAAARVIHEVQSAIPADYWNKARCVASFPELWNTEFVVGGTYAKGVMSCRTGVGWTAPAFLEIERGRRISQLGALELDIVLLMMNERVSQLLVGQHVTLGADVSIAPGPLDSQAQIDLTTRRADVLVYSRARGLYMNLAGVVLEPDGDSNRDVYGKGVSLRTILDTRDVAAPIETRGFIVALTSQPTWPPTVAQRRGPPDNAHGIQASASAPVRFPAAAPLMTWDGDLRTRVLGMQQILDRMLADRTPAPVGTSGTFTAEPVTVDRARLLQIRQQLDSMMAELDRR
jgi:lipid-binding SYLF domain-containing protein